MSKSENVLMVVLGQEYLQQTGHRPQLIIVGMRVWFEIANSAGDGSTPSATPSMIAPSLQVEQISSFQEARIQAFTGDILGKTEILSMQDAYGSAIYGYCIWGSATDTSRLKIDPLNVANQMQQLDAISDEDKTVKALVKLMARLLGR